MVDFGWAAENGMSMKAEILLPLARLANSY